MSQPPPTTPPPSTSTPPIATAAVATSSISPLAEAILRSIPLNTSTPLVSKELTDNKIANKMETNTAPILTSTPVNKNNNNNNTFAKASPIAPTLQKQVITPILAPAPTTAAIMPPPAPIATVKQEPMEQDIKLNNSSTTRPTPLQRNVPAFLNKLYSIVSDPSSDDLIRWSDDGASFFVNQQDEFARKVLPRFFKHKKFSSFVRQLNMYGFHKVPHLQQGVLENESERWEFSNPHFQKDQPDLLLLVTRKKGQHNEKNVDNVDLHHILEEIQSIKKHQMNISTQLSSIQRDNQALWQETVAARERHHRHQETIDKILRFLASVFSNNEKRGNAISRKRRYLLGPGDDYDQEVSEPPIKLQKQQEEQQQQQQQQQQQTFDLDDLVQYNELSNIDLKRNNTTDLQDAIALNDKTKLDNTYTTPPVSTTNITTTTTSTHQQQKSNISLNPDLSTVNAEAIAAATALSIPNLTQIQGLQNLIALAQANPELLNQLTTDTFYSSNLTNPSSIDQVTANITHLTNSADALNQDIDDLGTSIEQLAQHLGFDPTRNKQNEDEEGEEEDLLDMDEFLNTYDDQIELPPSTITDLPSTTTTRSPSPIVTTPGSVRK